MLYSLPLFYKKLITNIDPINHIYPQANRHSAISLFIVDTTNAIERLDDDLNRHSRLDANTIHALAILGGHLIDGHRLKIKLLVVCKGKKE